MKCGRIAWVMAWVMAAAAAWGQVKVGDKPRLEFEAVDGTPVSLEGLRGKLIVIDFWATWCGPCMQMGPHMVELNRKYGPQGVVTIGISLDQSKADLVRVAEESGFTWPHYFDGKGWKNQVAVAWGVKAIPHVFLVNPTGEVVYSGNPGGLEQAIVRAMKDTPPSVLGERLTVAASEALDKAEAAIKENQHGTAAAAISKFPPEVKLDKKLGPRLAEVQKQLEDYATAALGEADSLIEQKQFAEASAKLQGVARLAGMPAATKATAKLRELQSNPEARAAVEAAAKAEREKEREAKAAEALAAAQKLQAEEKHEQAYGAYRNVMTMYAKTPAAGEAEAAVKAYEQDATFMKKVGTKAIDGKAKSLLSMAASYRAAGKTEEAKQRYQAVIDQFPNTPYAEEAKREMGKM